MFQGKERAQGVAHLVVFRIPINLGIVEIVECLIASRFLSIIDQRHAIERIGKDGERIAVGAILLCQRLFRLVPVLVVIGHIEHTSEGKVGRSIQQCIAKNFQTSRRIARCSVFY